jgi:glycerol kinase
MMGAMVILHRLTQFLALVVAVAVAKGVLVKTGALAVAEVAGLAVALVQQDKVLRADLLAVAVLPLVVVVVEVLV